MKRILSLMLMLMVFGCTQKSGSILKKPPISTADKIIGKYYVTDFSRNAFTLLTDKPQTKYQLVFEFTFEPSGVINVKDLTDFYDCGNGILSLQKCEWINHSANIYRLRFVGEYALESEFEFIGDYKLQLNDGKKTMTLVDSIFQHEKTLY